MTKREMNHWGWGYADHFGSAEQRAGMGAMVEQMLGFSVPAPREPVAMADIDLGDSRLTIPRSLASFCSTAPEERIRHTYGKGYRDLLRGFFGDYGSAPDLVAHPRQEADIMAVLDWAADQQVAVIPFGGGTSVVGGVEAVVGGDFRATLSLDMRAMDRVLEVDTLSRSACIQAGATGPGIEQQLGVHGLTLRHFPQSFEFSTLGGWIATRAGGHFATLYTHIDDLVQSTRMLTPTGVMETRRLPASGAGPSPDRLVLGSEGTLGVITQAWMRVRPRPVHRSRANVLFSDYGQAVGATRAVAQAYLYPSNCRLLDRREAMLNGVSLDGSNVLLLGFESAEHPMHGPMEDALAICLDHGGTCPAGALHEDSSDPGDVTRAGESGRWRQAFLDAPYLQNSLVSLGVIADTFETACTWDRFEALHADLIATMRAAMKRICGAGFISCRFTHVYPDGPAPYYTFIAPARAPGPGQSELAATCEQWQELKQAASDTLLAHQATITHHHAVGRLHRPWYDQQRPDAFAEVLRAAKRSLDPAGVLNPGVLFK